MKNRNIYFSLGVIALGIGANLYCFLKADTYWRNDTLCVSHTFNGISVSQFGYQSGSTYISTILSPPATVEDCSGPCFTSQNLQQMHWRDELGKAAPPPGPGTAVTLHYSHYKR